MESDDATLTSAELRRFTCREYDALVDAGYFEDEKIELLRGLLVTMSPQGDEHSLITTRIANTITRALPPRFGIAVHSPFCATDDSEPEPDICVFDATKFLRTKPTEALLIVEVAHSSLRRDRNIKLPIYAEAGVPEYWIILVATQIVEIYTEPRNGTYTKMERILSDGVLRPRIDPTIAIEMRSLPWPEAS
jgi:Uma2 family endonuclease